MPAPGRLDALDNEGIGLVNDGLYSLVRQRLGSRLKVPCGFGLGFFLVSVLTDVGQLGAVKFGGGFAPYTINAPPALRAGMTKDTSPQRQQGTDRSCTNKIRSE